MGASREKDQADFDLERLIDMFDTAMTSDDPRVKETLRKLMMIVALVQPETGNGVNDRRTGPLRRVIEDTNHIHNRLSRVENDLSRLTREVQHAESAAEQRAYNWTDQDKYSMAAASQVAQNIDDNIVTKLSAQINYPRAIKGLK